MRTQPEHLLLHVETAKKIGAAGSCKTTSAPDDKPYLTRRTALNPLNATRGFLQPICGGKL